MYRLLGFPLLRLLPPEAAHSVAFFALRVILAIPGVRALFQRLTAARHPRLAVEVLGKTFPSPIGLAAGFDKDALGVEALGALGFGFVEVGTLTAQCQSGNPKPRVFRLVEDRALINRLGFNNRGAADAQRRLARARHTLVGVNIGKTQVVSDVEASADYAESARLLAPTADYLVVNVSSPNTPGLRALQALEPLRAIILAVRLATKEAVPFRHVPVLVKIAPDLDDDEIDAITDLAIELHIDGIVATNTTVKRDGLSSPEKAAAIGDGGLSGKPLAGRSLAVLRRITARAGGKLVLVSVGGIATAQDVHERLQAGAALVQIYTALVYEGPFLLRRLHRELSRLKSS